MVLLCNSLSVHIIPKEKKMTGDILSTKSNNQLCLWKDFLDAELSYCSGQSSQFSNDKIKLCLMVLSQ